MSESAPPEPAAAWILGAPSTPPRLDRGGPTSAGETRWVHFTDEDAFRAYVGGFGHAMRAVAGRLRFGFGRHRPLAHVRRLADEWLIVQTPTIWYTEADRQVHTGAFACVVGRDEVITLETGEAQIYDETLERLQTMIGPWAAESTDEHPRAGERRHATHAGGPHGGAWGSGVQRVAVAGLLAVLASASDIEVALGDAVAETEGLVFDDAVTDPVARIYGLKREITEARRALLPFSAVVPELVDAEDERWTTFAEGRMLERLVSGVERIDRHLDTHDGLLSDMLQVHLAQVSVRQNEDMRKISAWAAILVYPTIVAGVYGMNFTHMPELGWLWGYPFAIALMGVGCFVLFRLFKKAGWL